MLSGVKDTEIIMSIICKNINIHKYIQIDTN